MSGLRAAFLFLISVATIKAQVISYILPTAIPTTSDDSWECLMENITQYFDVPTPTGALLTAYQSFGRDLYKPCLTQSDGCHFPDRTSWCGFSTAAPSSILSDYWSFASVASSWWSAHSIKAVSVAQECPYGWYGAMMGRGLGGEELNGTIALSECAKARPGSALASPTSGSSTIGGSTIGSSTIGTGATSRSGTKTTSPTQTLANAAVGWADIKNGRLLGGAGLAVVAILGAM